MFQGINGGIIDQVYVSDVVVKKKVRGTVSMGLRWDQATSVVEMARELARYRHDISQIAIAPVARGLKVFERALVNEI